MLLGGNLSARGQHVPARVSPCVYRASLYRVCLTGRKAEFDRVGEWGKGRSVEFSDRESTLKARCKLSVSRAQTFLPVNISSHDA